MGTSGSSNWQVLLLDPTGRVRSGRRVTATFWLEAVKRFADLRGQPVGDAGLVCSIQPNRSFLVYESRTARMFLARSSGGAGAGEALPEGRTSTVRGMGAFGAEPVPGQVGSVMPAAPPPSRSGSLQVMPSQTGAPDNEPAVVVDPEIVQEAARLEQMARWSEAEPAGAGDLPPHRVLWCKKVDDNGEEKIRCALAVWPDSGGPDLERLLLSHLKGLVEQLSLRPDANTAVVAAFDHAFHQVPIRPPLAAAVWGGPHGDSPRIRIGAEAASAWPEIQSSGAGLGFRTAGDSGTVMVPAVRLDAGPPDGAPAEVPESHIPTAMVARPEVSEGRRRAVRGPGKATAPEIPSKREGPRTESLLFMAFDALHAIYQCGDRSEAVGVVLGAAARLVPAEAVAVYLFDESSGAMRLEGLRHSKTGALPEVRVAMGQGLAGTCAAQSVPLALTNLHRDSRFGSVLASALGIEPTSLVGAPVEHQGRLFGAMELVNRTGRQGFSGGEVEAVAYAGRMLGERLTVLPLDGSDPPTE